jgi:hypothetical protein
MGDSQDTSTLTLKPRWVGALPLVNAILQRLNVSPMLCQTLPPGGRLSHAQALGVLLRNIALNDRQPLYTHTEWATRAEPALNGLEECQAGLLNDDRVGRALDRLSNADRASLLTQLVLGAIREFRIDLDQLHNDSTN